LRQVDHRLCVIDPNHRVAACDQKPADWLTGTTAKIEDPAPARQRLDHAFDPVVRLEGTRADGFSQGIWEPVRF
jgi:hypothetical protein